MRTLKVSNFRGSFFICILSDHTIAYKEERYCQSNTYLGKTEYKYDKNKTLTEETKYYFYGPIESKVIYEYDSIGNTIEKIYCLNNDGKLVISDIVTLKRSF